MLTTTANPPIHQLVESEKTALTTVSSTNAASMKVAPTSRSTFRPEIQGLRALAVLVVVVFHLHPAFLTGGYVGVDVFFVISGYLITSHLVSEFETSGRIALVAFWSRRIRRLLPAALLVLASSAVATVLWVPRALWTDTFHQIMASALYAQNWLLATNSVDYLGAENQPSLVQHYWSLSTEEQFYLVWPLVIFAVFLAFRRRAQLAIAIAAIFGMSLVCSIIWTGTSAASAYFVTPVRAWEFAAGALVVFAPRAPQSVRLAASWSGLGLIVFACVSFTAETPFPGWTALVPVVGTALVIWASAPESRWSPVQVLQIRPVQYLGSVSYSVYLWHWPLIVLFPLITGQQVHKKAVIVIVVVTLILASATKVLVEDPFRRSGQRLFGPPRLFLVTGAAMAGVVVLALVPLGVMDTQVAQQRVALEQALRHGSGCLGAPAMVASNKCAQPYAMTDTVDPAQAAADTPWSSGAFAVSQQQRHCGHVHCDFGVASHPGETIALVGDSHAQQWIDPLVQFGRTDRWRLLTYTFSGCSMLMPNSARWPAAPGAGGRSCPQLGAGAIEEISNNPNIGLVLFSNYTARSPISTAQALADIKQLRSAGKKVAVMRDMPGPSARFVAPTCVEQHSKEYDPCALPLPSADDQMTEIARQADVPLIDLSKYACSAKSCHVVIGGMIAYFDNNHMTATFARTLAPFVGSAVRSALLPARGDTGYRVID